MPIQNPSSGFGSVPEYQMSGIPWVLSGSVGTTPVEYDLPFVSRAITIANNSAATNFLCVGFTQNGVQLTNSFLIDGGKSFRFELRVRDLWFKGQNSTVNFCVLAELTGIQRKQMPYLTGSLSSPLGTPTGDLIASSSIVYNGVG